LLALLGAHPIFHVSRIRVKPQIITFSPISMRRCYIRKILMYFSSTYVFKLMSWCVSSCCLIFTKY
jgi:hypothetical protein